MPSRPGIRERRDKFLRAGRELVREDQRAGLSRAPLALSHVRLADVAEREGVRKSAVYHYWHSHEDFREELLEALVTDGRLAEALEQAAAGCAATNATRPRDVWEVGDAMFETMSGDDLLLVALAMLSYRLEGTALDELSRATEEAIADIDRFLVATLPRVGLEFCPGGPPRDLATSLFGLLVGVCVRHRRLGPDASADAAAMEGRHSLFADGAAALIFAATVQVSPGGVRRPGTVG